MRYRNELGQAESMNRIEVPDTGELLPGIAACGSEDYQYVYREARGVYWDPLLKGFKSTEMRDGTPSQWYAHIAEIV